MNPFPAPCQSLTGRMRVCSRVEVTFMTRKSPFSRLCDGHLLHHAGVISSNGVNGSQATETDSGTGIQVLHDSISP